MHVGRIMNTELITVAPDTPVTKAKKIIEDNSISHLLVVDKKGKFTGIVSDRDVKQSWASPATALSGTSAVSTPQVCCSRVAIAASAAKNTVMRLPSIRLLPTMATIKSNPRPLLRPPLACIKSVRKVMSAKAKTPVWVSQSGLRLRVISRPKRLTIK